MEARIKADAAREALEAKKTFETQQSAAQEVAKAAHAWIPQGVKNNRFSQLAGASIVMPPRSRNDAYRSTGLSSLPKADSRLIPTDGYNLELQQAEVENQRLER